MAGRSTPPVSSLVSAATAQPSLGRRPRPRPRFARLPSASSSHAARSDESLTSTLNNLSLADAKDINFRSSGITTSGRPASPIRQSYLQETPGRRGSKPINIEVPKRQPVYTPLSARGDLPGGYFPHHETLMRQYKPHPFKKSPSTPASPIMSNTSSTLSSPSSATPRVTQSMLSPTYSAAPSPDALALPIGKYHPSNYKPVDSSTTSSAPLSPTQLEIPSSGKSNKRPAYERRTSDVKRKLQQYQRDMIAQARQAGLRSAPGDMANPKPSSPKLQPLGSPGPITPLELEESAGYMAAGMHGTDREREMEFERMIEQERSMKGGGSGSASPVLRV